ncbi:uncharacterized protein BBOV_IV011430 [Babesia bovis T2Bo]|uniref:Membrane protein, putative n=1 Tax=Babesia bovis TaxID=5865 RepID=A7ASH6_BABBO|nr:uncharacterized protein BBOV_IV011430 [Babesia bovis T2Bo]EDO07495.1 rhoptry neck protein RON5 [Babesia bovis T2Bo]|eukprot:XP_001611063.1 hypothetical protein [Babesia bovis T2Bo]
MALFWILYSAISLCVASDVSLLQNPFGMDTPLPVVNLLQLGTRDSIPLTGSILPAAKKVADSVLSMAGDATQKGGQLTDMLSEKIGKPISNIMHNANVQDLKNKVASAVTTAAQPLHKIHDTIKEKTSVSPPSPVAHVQGNPEKPQPTKTDAVMPDSNFPTIDGANASEDIITPAVPVAAPDVPKPVPDVQPKFDNGEPEANAVPAGENAQPKEEQKIEMEELPTSSVKVTVDESPSGESITDNANSDEAITVSGGTTSATVVKTDEPSPDAGEITSAGYDEKDMQKEGDATAMNLNDVIEGGKDGMSKMTMSVDQDWLNKERAVEAMQKALPTGTSYSYKKGARLLTPISETPRMMAGVLQTIIDKEAEVRRRYKESVQIEHDLRLRVSRETADVIALLSNGSLAELKSEHPLVFSRLVEPLKASIALNHVRKSAQNIISFYDRNWYVRASPKEKATLLDNIRKDTGKPDLYAHKVKKPQKMTPEKERVYNILDGYFNDYQCQKIIRGNQVARQMLNMFDQASGLYVAPFYTDVTPTLGSSWLIQRFENFYSRSEYLRADILAQAMPQLIGRFMVMAENGTILPTSTDVQLNLYSLAAVLSKIMDGVTEPTTFLGKRKFYGYMGMCDMSCAKGIVTNFRSGDPLKSFVHNKQREILRWVSLYLRDDLLRIDTSIQKLLVEIMFRTTNDMKYRPSNRKVNIHLKSEYVDPNANESLLELPHLMGYVNKIPGRVKQIPRAIGNMQAPEFLTNVSKRPNFHRLGNVIDHAGNSFNRFMSGYRVPGRIVDNKLEGRNISPYNAFKTPRKVVASLDDGLLQMIEVAVDLVNLRSSSDANNLYYQAFNTWVQLQSFHSAIHSFEYQSSRKRTSSKTLGAIFRYLNTSVGKHIEGMPKQFLPFTSLVLQICFFIEDAVDGYRRGKYKRLKNFLTGILTLGLKSRLGPSNITELQSYLEPQVVYNKSRYVIGRAIISNLVQDFKLMFLNKPAIPMPIIQAISMFLGMWARGSSAKLDLSDPTIDTSRRIFFLNYMSNKYDLAMTATEIVVQHCAAAAPVLHLGCVPRNVKGTVKCKNVAIPTTKYHVLKVMQMMDATFEDPLDIIRVGSDLARRCIAMPVRKNVVVKKGKKAKADSYDSAIMFSELAHRYHCYQEQATLVAQINKAMLQTKDMNALSASINDLFKYSRSLTIRQPDHREMGPTLVCPFMEDAPEATRDRYRERMVKYAASKMTIRRKIIQEIKVLGASYASDLPIANRKSSSSSAPLESIAGAILVGTRQFDGIFFYGGYPPPEKIPMPESVTVNPGDGRVVYHNKEFIAEVVALKPLGVNAVMLEKQNKVTKRIYYMDKDKKLDELAFGLEAADFVVRAHLLTTASTLREMGYNIGKFIWCGYEQGWIADFALHNIIGNSDVPVFNGKYWILSKQMKVADVVGKNVRIKHGEKIMDQNASDVNVKVIAGDGKEIAKYPATKPGQPNFDKQGSNNFTLDTGYGEVSPAAVQDLIRDAEFDEATNTLVLNLDAPSIVLMESPIVSNTTEEKPTE